MSKCIDCYSTIWRLQTEEKVIFRVPGFSFKYFEENVDRSYFDITSIPEVQTVTNCLPFSPSKTTLTVFSFRAGLTRSHSRGDCDAHGAPSALINYAFLGQSAPPLICHALMLL